MTREEAIKTLRELWRETNDHWYEETYSMAIEALERAPSVDVKPVRHGRWETVEGWDGDELYRCSECGDEFVLIEGTPKDNNYWFCPCCGARMDGEQNG